MASCQLHWIVQSANCLQTASRRQACWAARGILWSPICCTLAVLMRQSQACTDLRLAALMSTQRPCHGVGTSTKQNKHKHMCLMSTKQRHTMQKPQQKCADSCAVQQVAGKVHDVTLAAKGPGSDNAASVRVRSSPAVNFQRLALRL